MEGLFMSPSQEFGLVYEQYAVHLLQSLQHEVKIAPSFSHPGYDLLVDGCLMVDVKVSTRRHHKAKPRVWRGRYQFRLTAGCDLFLCFCVRPSRRIDAFFIPAASVEKPSLNITSLPEKYSGWASCYFWDVSQVSKLVREKRETLLVNEPFTLSSSYV